MAGRKLSDGGAPRPLRRTTCRKCGKDLEEDNATRRKHLPQQPFYGLCRACESARNQDLRRRQRTGNVNPPNRPSTSSEEPEPSKGQCSHTYPDGARCVYTGELINDKCREHDQEARQKLAAARAYKRRNPPKDPDQAFIDHTAPWHCSYRDCTTCDGKPDYSTWAQQVRDRSHTATT